MDCEEIRNRLADCLIGDGPGGGGARAVPDEVRQHLAACAACREEAESLAQTWTALGTVASPPPDSAAMRQRFDAMLDAYTEDQRARPTAWTRRASRWLRSDARASGSRWEARAVGAAAAAVLLLVTGALAGGRLAGRFGRHDAGSPSTNAEIAELRRELRDTQQLVMLSLLQHTSAGERLNGVGWSYTIEEPGPEVVSALLDSLTHDPNVNVRLGCVDALMRFSTRPVVRQGIVRALNESTSPIVQIALIDFVVEVGEKESVAALRRLSMDAALNEAVRERAKWGLQHLL
jgi:HEAT repeats